MKYLFTSMLSNRTTLRYLLASAIATGCAFSFYRYYMLKDVKKPSE